MAHYHPVVYPAGQSVAGESLGFHAYSLRIDNCTNQWYLEESTVSFIPPYSLGMCLRLYGTAVAILLAQAPVGQPQLAPIVGEQVVGVFSDQLRTEVAASPIRQFTLVQSVSDLTQGPMPATPPVGVTRMWAAADGTIHYLLPNATDATLLSSTNYAAYVGGSPLGGDLTGTVSNGHVNVQTGSQITMQGSTPVVWSDVQFGRWNPGQMRITGSGGLTVQGPVSIEADQVLQFAVNGYGWKGLSGSAAVYTAGSIIAAGGNLYLASPASNSLRVWWDGTYINHAPHVASSGHVYSQGGNYYAGGSNQTLFQMWNPGELRLSSSPGNFFAVGIVQCYGGGMTGAGPYTNSASSRRLKHNISELDPDACLSQVLGLRPVSFEYNAPMRFPAISTPEPDPDAPVPDWTPERLGFIAEEVAEIVPQAVGMLDGIGEGLSVEQLVPVLWGAVRALESRLAAVEGAA